MTDDTKVKEVMKYSKMVLARYVENQDKLSQQQNDLLKKQQRSCKGMFYVVRFDER